MSNRYYTQSKQRRVEGHSQKRPSPGISSGGKHTYEHETSRGYHAGGGSDVNSTVPYSLGEKKTHFTRATPEFSHVKAYIDAKMSERMGVKSDERIREGPKQTQEESTANDLGQVLTQTPWPSKNGGPPQIGPPRRSRSRGRGPY